MVRQIRTNRAAGAVNNFNENEARSAPANPSNNNLVRIQLNGLMDNVIEQQNAHSNDHLNISFNRNPHSFHSLPNHLLQHQRDVSNLTMNSA